MGTFIWMIVGIILLTITIFVHKHTYWRKSYREQEHKMPLPVWLFTLMVIIAFVPILNITAFVIGLIAYFVYRWDPLCAETYFRCELRWWGALIGFLTKEV